MKSSVMRVTASAASDVGRLREGNEDSFYAGSTVFAVADGMGGHQAGEVASALALEPLHDVDGRDFPDASIASEALVAAIEEANRRVVERSLDDADLRGMGTTLTAVLVHGDSLIAAHVGDSRAYLLRRGQPISQLTTDHTLVERLVREGRLSRDEVAFHPQRNVITRAIGNDPDVVVDALPPLQLQPGDRILVCSDGLTGPIDDRDIQMLVDTIGGGQDAVDALVHAANEAGGPDNITVILVEVEGGTAGDAPVAGSAARSGPQPTPQDHHLDDHRLADGDAAAADDDGSRSARTAAATTDADWAETMRRLGAGEDHRQPAGRRPGRRLLAGVLAAAILVGLLVGGGYFLLSRAYFVGEHDGMVAIHRGLPERVAGVPLYWVMSDEISDITVDDLPAFRRTDVTEGLSAGTLREAQQLVDVLRQQLEEQGGATPLPAPTPTSPTAVESTPTEDPGT